MKNIIIIGSGIGGLITGNLLAKKGHNVTIFESHSMPGGYTAGFYRKGYYFESGTVCFESAPTIFRAMKEIGLPEIDFIKLSMRVASEDFDGTPGNFGEFKKLIYPAFPADKEQLDLAFADLDQTISAMRWSADIAMPPLASWGEMMKSMLPSLPRMIRVINRFGKMLKSDFAAGYFDKDSKLFKLFTGFGYRDMSTIFVATALDGLFNGLWTVKGGMQSWADTLADNFRKLGGDLKLKSYVDKIITNDGTAMGVISKDVVYKADYVISAGDYKKTFLQLLDDKSLIPETLKNKIEKSPVSEGYFTVYLGLNISNEELGNYMKDPHGLAFNLTCNRDINNPNDSEFFAKTTIEIYSPSMVNSKLAPEGKSSLMLQTKAPYRWMNNWGGGEREAYKQLKKKAMDAMIDNASKFIPGLADYIEYKEAATPLTYERYTHNTDGASCAWYWNPRKSFYKNSLGVNIKTPVKNLYIGSSWAIQVGGVPGAIAAAYQCVKQIK